MRSLNRKQNGFPVGRTLNSSMRVAELFFFRVSTIVLSEDVELYAAYRRHDRTPVRPRFPRPFLIRFVQAPMMSPQGVGRGVEKRVMEGCGCAMVIDEMDGGRDGGRSTEW